MDPQLPVPDRPRMVCEYDAADLASVRNVQRKVEAKFDRAWAADVLVLMPNGSLFGRPARFECLEGTHSRNTGYSPRIAV